MEKRLELTEISVEVMKIKQKMNMDRDSSMSARAPAQLIQAKAGGGPEGPEGQEGPEGRPGPATLKEESNMGGGITKPPNMKGLRDAAVVRRF